MTAPKYSVILPTLNGAETLKVTLPRMLALDRDDVEFVISNNHSTDDTEELLHGFSDRRLRIVSPPAKLPIGRHLEFAYLQARGAWQGHIGDDDLILPSRFDTLDRVMTEVPDAGLIRGEFLRYHWPEYPNPKLANGLDARTYSDAIRRIRGATIVRHSINESVVFGGGAWCVKAETVEAVRSRCGFFSSPQHVEFFAMRAALAASEWVAITQIPVYIMGRHEKSSAAQGLRPRDETHREGWDWSFEDPDPWAHCPFPYKGYATLSLDAALCVKELYPEVLADADIDWRGWAQSVHNDLTLMIRYRQLPADAMLLFEKGVRRLPPRIRLRHWLLERQHIQRPLASFLTFSRELRSSYRALATRATVLEPSPTEPEPVDTFGWQSPLRGDRVGIANICDVADWVERTFWGFFPPKE